MVWLIAILALVSSLGLLEDQKKSETPYSPKYAFNKTLNSKMKYFYNWHMIWLKVYMNLVLPYLAATSVITAYQTFQVTKEVSFDFFLTIAYFVIMVLNVWLFRAIDSVSFVFNIFANFFLVFRIAVVSSYFSVLIIIMIGLPVLINIGYFFKRRELFFKSAKQLQKLYSLE